MLSTRDALRFKHQNRLRVKAWKEICHANSNHKSWRA